MQATEPHPPRRMAPAPMAAACSWGKPASSEEPSAGGTVVPRSESCEAGGGAVPETGTVDAALGAGAAEAIGTGARVVVTVVLGRGLVVVVRCTYTLWHAHSHLASVKGPPGQPSPQAQKREVP
jgi:hypothetical protein